MATLRRGEGLRSGCSLLHRRDLGLSEAEIAPDAACYPTQVVEPTRTSVGFSSSASVAEA